MSLYYFKETWFVCAFIIVIIVLDEHSAVKELPEEIQGKAASQEFVCDEGGGTEQQDGAKLAAWLNMQQMFKANCE